MAECHGYAQEEEVVMTVEELREAAAALGYTIIKRPSYDCSCYVGYPNESFKKKNGKWKCVDCYEPCGVIRNKQVCKRKDK